VDRLVRGSSSLLGRTDKSPAHAGLFCCLTTVVTDVLGCGYCCHVATNNIRTHTLATFCWVYAEVGKRS